MQRLISLLIVVSSGLYACRPKGDDGSAILAAAAELQPLQQKTVTHPDCGIKQYRARVSPICRPIFRERADDACPVDLYNLRPDLKCEGSIASDRYTEVASSGTCGNKDAPAPAACRPGYRAEYSDRKQKCERRGHDNYQVWYQIYEKINTCIRDEKLQSCRRPEFGVERYRSCRAESHGIETYESCRREEFGVEEYNTCSVYKTTDEVEFFIQDREMTLPTMAKSLIVNRAAYVARQRNEPVFACHIKKYEKSPLFKQQVADLKTKYKETFSRDYDESRYGCPVQAQDDIDTVECTDSSDLCRTVRVYRAAKRYLEVVKADAHNVAEDITQRAKAELVERLRIVERNAGEALAPSEGVQ